ncbi:MAG: hypothetical protein AAF950_17220 [Pseudomonadota bacterium]
MSLSGQDFGLTDGDPVILGKTFVVQFTITGLQASEVVSAEWILADQDPGIGTSTPIVTKTVGSGITLTNSGADLQVTVTVDPADTATLTAGDYFHRLDYVHSDGSQYEAARGTGRLTARV